MVKNRHPNFDELKLEKLIKESKVFNFDGVVSSVRTKCKIIYIKFKLYSKKKAKN